MCTEALNLTSKTVLSKQSYCFCAAEWPFVYMYWCAVKKLLVRAPSTAACNSEAIEYTCFCTLLESHRCGICLLMPCPLCVWYADHCCINDLHHWAKWPMSMALTTCVTPGMTEIYYRFRSWLGVALRRISEFYWQHLTFQQSRGWLTSLFSYCMFIMSLVLNYAMTFSTHDVDQCWSSSENFDTCHLLLLHDEV